MSRRKPSLAWKTFWCCSLWIALGALHGSAVVADPTREKAATEVAAPKNVAELKAIESQVQKVVAKVLPCTVGVQIGGSRGSGVIVSEDGYVMTAGHVVGQPGRDVIFLFPDGNTAKGKTLGMFQNADAGLMKITDQGKWPFVEKGRSAELKSGAWCLAVGHPMGYQKERPPVVRLGRILRARETVIQTDCLLVGGDSGGPLLDLQGKVIGINSRIGGPTSMNFHVPVDVFHDNWDRLVKGDSWQLDLPGRDDDEVKAAFREVVAAAAKCTVRIKCNGKDAALGTIVGPDGWILTKASELKGKIVCSLRDRGELEAQKIGVHEAFDLAMLKVDAYDLPAIDWTTEKPSVGQWVAAPGLDDDPIALGAVSVPPRKIPHISGQLGIRLREGKGGAPVDRVEPKSPAEKAGLKVGDLITHVNGKPTPSREELITAIRQHRIGDVVKLTVKRGEKELEITAILGKVNSAASRKREMQNSMGVGLSKRRDAFPTVLQHDTVLKPVDCGGPLVDLSGKVVGINIARGGRTETYCVPAEEVLSLMYNLMSGRLTPPEVKKQRERKAEEERKKAEEERKKAEAEKKAREEREKAEAEKKAEEERKKAEEKKKDQPEEKPPPQENKPEEKKTDAASVALLLTSITGVTIVAEGDSRGKPWPIHVIDDSSRGADGVRLADVNGDQLMDIATGWEEGGITRVYVHPGCAAAEKPWPAVTVGKTPNVEDAVFVDLDADGQVDVVSCCQGGTQTMFVHWAPQHEDEYLEPGAWRTEPIPASQKAMAWMFCLPVQVDCRHGIDLIAAGKGRGARIGWFEAPRNPRRLNQWAWHPISPAGWIMSLRTADLDGDGDLDLVTTDRKGEIRGCRWLQNPGPGEALRGPWRNRFLGGQQQEVMFMTIADVDADGADDLLVAVKPKSLLFLRRAAEGAEKWLSRSIALPENTGTGKGVAVGDVDRDGKPDVVFSCEAASGSKSGVIWLSYNQTPMENVWTPHEISGPAGIKFDRLELLDLDGDGDLDVLACEENQPAAGNRRGLGVFWYENPTVK